MIVVFWNYILISTTNTFQRFSMFQLVSSSSYFLNLSRYSLDYWFSIWNFFILNWLLLTLSYKFLITVIQNWYRQVRIKIQRCIRQNKTKFKFLVTILLLSQLKVVFDRNRIVWNETLQIDFIDLIYYLQIRKLHRWWTFKSFIFGWNNPFVFSLAKWN